MRIGVGGGYEPGWAQPSIRDRRLARPHHDKAIQGSATMHPSEVGRSGRLQGPRPGRCWVPRLIASNTVSWGFLFLQWPSREPLPPSPSRRPSPHRAAPSSTRRRRRKGAARLEHRKHHAQQVTRHRRHIFGSSGGSVGLHVRRGVPVPLLCSRRRRSPFYAACYGSVGNGEEAPVLLRVQPTTRIPDEPYIPLPGG